LGPTIYTADIILNNMIDYNEAGGGGVMRFVDGYYTSPNSTDSLPNQKHIPKSSYTKRMVKYALQRKKPWPQMEKLIIKLLQLIMPNIDYTKSAHLQTVNKFFTAMDKYADALNPQWKEYNDIKSEMLASIGQSK